LCNSGTREFKSTVRCSLVAPGIDVNKARKPAISFAMLVVVIAAVPVLAITPGWLGPQLLSLAVAVMLLLLSGAPDTDIARSLAVFKPLTTAALLPGAWMLLQLVPLPPGSIEHPVWRSAAAALAEPLSGHVSIDLGDTMRGLSGYLSLIALAFLTAVLSRNRDRAETLLSVLCAITTFIAVESILFRDLAAVRSGNATADFADSVAAIAAFGAILNAALVVRTVERHETQARGRPQPLRAYAGMMLLGVAGVTLCLIALMTSTTYDMLIAVAFGLTVVAVVVLIRRLSLGRWTAATVCAAVLVAWAGVIALRFAANPAVSPLFRFATLQPTEAGATILRMMSDANWAGSGVGSYQALAAIYRDAAGSPSETAINTISSVVLEWGFGGLAIAIFLPLQLLVVLVRGALTRGRDSFYAAGAAGCLVTTFCEAFCDASLTDLTVEMIAAIVVGLGLSQTIGSRVT
jgi:hypothetical protein